MVTDLHRRHALAVLGGLGACAIIPAPAALAQAGDRVHLAAAWERQGRFHIGLLSTQGGRGVLASGVPGTQPARVVVIGGGQVGASAGIRCSMRNEATVMSSGIPKVVKVERKRNSPCAELIRVSSSGGNSFATGAGLRPAGRVSSSLASSGLCSALPGHCANLFDT